MEMTPATMAQMRNARSSAMARTLTTNHREAYTASAARVM